MTPQKVFWIAAACLVAFQLFLRYDHWRLDDGRRAEYDMLTGKTVVLEKNQRRNLVQWITGATPRKRNKPMDDEDEDTLDDASAVAMSGVSDDRPKPRFKSEAPTDRWFETDSPPREKRRPAPDEPVTERRLDSLKADDLPNSTRTEKQTTVTQDAPRKKVKQDPPPVAKAPTPDDAVDQLAKPPAPRLADVARQKPRVAVNDLNQDGDGEQIIQSAPTKSGVIDFSIVNQGKEVFYGKGYQLRVLTTRHQGWSDLAVIKPNDQVDVFRYNPDDGSYQPTK